MDRRSLWPDFRPPWILHEDGAVMAVHKPAGVPSLPSDAPVADDLAARVARFLGERDGLAPEAIRLGAHLHLERGVSGVTPFGRSRAANAGLARQLEGRVAPWTFVAAVTGYEGGERTLRNRVVRGRDGELRIADRGGRSAKPAECRVRPIGHRGDRALVEILVIDGRPAQLRVQLAHAGIPIAGDLAHGGAPAPRLMLHAERLDLEHPTAGGRLALCAPRPPEMERWVSPNGRPTLDPADLDRVLAIAAERRFALGRADGAPEPTTAFRLFDGEGDGLSGVAVDVYGDHLVAHLYEGSLVLPEDVVLDALARLGFDGVYVKRRPRQANELSDGPLGDLAPATPLRGSAAPEELPIHELGVPYHVRLGDGLGTGLFLDQRDNRARVRAASEGARVLNLFAHTCAFSVAAAAGSARRTLSVDASAVALERGRLNLEPWQASGEHELLVGDVFEELGRLARAGERFDLVIVDPPTYSTTRASRWTSGRDWVGLAAAAFVVVVDGGRLLACSNDRRLDAGRLRAHLEDGASDAGRRLRAVKTFSPPSDFRPGSDARAALKTLWIEL